jgi:hypothetical protein
MIHRKFHCMKKLILFAGALALGAFTLAAEVPPAEKLLPADTLGTLVIPDYAKARDIYGRSPQGQLWHDPAMKAFVEKFQEKVKTEFVTPLEKDLGVSLTNYLPFLQGQLTFAFVQNGWAGGSESPQPGWLLLLDTKDKSPLLTTNLTELKRKWTDANKPSRTEKIRDVEFTVLKLSTNDVPPTLQKLFPSSGPKFPDTNPEDPETKKNEPPAIELFIGQSGSLLIAGNQAKVIEKVLTAQSSDSAPTLAAQPVFEANRLALFRNAPLYGWLNTKAITDIINKQLAKKAGGDADSPSFTPFKPEKVIGAFGLDALKSAAFSVHFTAEGGMAEFLLTAPESDRHGLLSLIAAEPKDTLPPPFVPADAVKFQRLRLDGSKTWDNLEKTVSALSPQLLAGLNFAIEMAGSLAKEKNPEYELKKTLLGSLGNDIVSYEKAPRSGDFVDMAAPPSITLIGVSKPDQFVEAVKYLITGASQRGQSPKEREFLGHKIYSMELPAMRTKDGKRGADRALSFSTANGYAAFSTDPALLEEFLRSSENPGKPLRATAGLTDAAQQVINTRTSWFTYENQAETMRSFLTSMKQNFGGDKATDKSASDNLGMTAPQKFIKEWFDISLLPEFDKIAKYFSFNVASGSATPEGLTMKVFTPTPPQLKPAAEAAK